LDTVSTYEQHHIRTLEILKNTKMTSIPQPAVDPGLGHTMIKANGDGSMTLQPTMSLTISSPSHSQQEKSFSHTPGDETLVETHSHSAFFEKQEKVFPPIDVMMEEKSYPTQSSPLSSVPPGSRTASQVQVMEPMETDTKPPPPLEPLPILPLLHYLAHNVSTTQKSRLLRLLLLSTDERAQALKKEPDLSDLLGWRSSQPPDNEFIEARIKHLDYLGLQLMLTAYKQDEDRLSSTEQVQLGVDIGKLGLEMLTCLQLEAEKTARAARSRSTPKFASSSTSTSTPFKIPDEGDRRKLKKVLSGDISLGRAPASPTPVSPSPLTNKSNNINTGVPLSRRTSSSRFDLYETPVKGKKHPFERVGSPLVSTAEDKVDLKHLETSNLIKEIEGVLTSSVSQALYSHGVALRSTKNLHICRL
jgi:hypothetical protein